MPIFDFDGTTFRENGKAYDFDGTTYRQHGKAYDNDGTTDRLLYTSEFPVYTNGVQDVSVGYKFESNNTAAVAGGGLESNRMWVVTIFTNYRGRVTSNWTLSNLGWTKAFVQCERTGGNSACTSGLQLNTTWRDDVSVAHGFNGIKVINISSYASVRFYAYVENPAQSQVWEYLYIYKIWFE